MSMTVDQIVSEARQLPQDLRAELLDRLGCALHGDASPEVAAEWNQLALDRLAPTDEFNVIRFDDFVKSGLRLAATSYR